MNVDFENGRAPAAHRAGACPAPANSVSVISVREEDRVERGTCVTTRAYARGTRPYLRLYLLSTLSR